MDIRSLTPTICHLMGLDLPYSSIADIQQGLIDIVKRNGIDTIKKCLVFMPDAIGRTIHDLYPGYFTDVERIIKHKENLNSIFPPKTPVCFASMFSGVSPEIHGIQKYERPVLKIDTLFDTLVRNGKRAAIVTIKNSSMDLIFRNRDIDYYIEPDDAQVIEKTLSILEEDRHDFLAVYNDEYDNLLHKTHQYSKECLEALKHHNDNFLRLHETIKRVWQVHNWLMVYAPDHGAHFNQADSVGTHGLNIPEDMDLIHYYAFSTK
jgi:predicted AlkP superfamily phosphohydrolase/phosphomutase